MLLSVVGDVLGNISRGWVLGNISQGWVLQADNNSGKGELGHAQGGGDYETVLWAVCTLPSTCHPIELHFSPACIEVLATIAL